MRAYMRQEDLPDVRAMVRELVNEAGSPQSVRVVFDDGSTREVQIAGKPVELPRSAAAPARK